MAMIGEIMFTNTTPRYSAPYPRAGEKVTFTVDVLQVSTGSPSLAIDIEHKNRADTSWTTVGSFSALTAVGLGTLTLTGLKEQYRYKCTQSGTNTWCSVLVNPPVWED